MRPRIASVDYIKAIAIVAVVITHAGLRAGDPNLMPFERILRKSWAGFHVPSFFVVAGFLYYQAHGILLSEVGRRLLRILLPYLLASSVVLLLRYTKSGDLSRIPYILATGHALGIYYFIFSLSLCIPLTWLFSRLKAPALWFLLTLLLLYTTAVAYRFLPRLTYGMFWSVREPFFTFYFGYFLIGWLTAHHLQQLQPLFDRVAKFLWPVLLLGAVVYVTANVQAMLNNEGLGRQGTLYRIAYTLCATGLITTFTRTLRVPAVIQFLSEASLTIYLYHFLFQVWLLPYTLTWSPVLRVLAILLAGLLGSSAIALGGRRVLGRRSRILLGY